jgi:hypothetical protein
VPEHALHDAVEVLLELPEDAALADAGNPGEGHQAGLAVPRRGMEEVLQQLQVLVATDEGRLEHRPTTPATAAGDHAHRLPDLDRALLALQLALA